MVQGGNLGRGGHNRVVLPTVIAVASVLGALIYGRNPRDSDRATADYSRSVVSSGDYGSSNAGGRSLVDSSVGTKVESGLEGLVTAKPLNELSDEEFHEAAYAEGSGYLLRFLRERDDKLFTRKAFNETYLSKLEQFNGTQVGEFLDAFPEDHPMRGEYPWAFDIIDQGLATYGPNARAMGLGEVLGEFVPGAEEFDRHWPNAREGFYRSRQWLLLNNQISRYGTMKSQSDSRDDMNLPPPMSEYLGDNLMDYVSKNLSPLAGNPDEFYGLVDDFQRAVWAGTSDELDEAEYRVSRVLDRQMFQEEHDTLRRIGERYAFLADSISGIDEHFANTYAPNLEEENE